MPRAAAAMPSSAPTCAGSVATMILPSRRCGTPCAAAVGVEHRACRRRRAAPWPSPADSRCRRGSPRSCASWCGCRSAPRARAPPPRARPAPAPGRRRARPRPAPTTTHSVRSMHALRPRRACPFSGAVFGRRQTGLPAAEAGLRSIPPSNPGGSRSRSGTPCVHRPPNRPPPAQARCPPRSGARPGPGCRAPRREAAAGGARRPRRRRAPRPHAAAQARGARSGPGARARPPGAAGLARLGLPRPGDGDPDRPRPRLGRRRAALPAPAARRAPGAAAGLLRGRPAPGARARPARARAAGRSARRDPPRRLVVYTTAFGAEPDAAPIHDAIPGLRFLCLTDRAERRGSGLGDGGRRPRRPPIRRSPAPGAASSPHRALAAAAPEAEASLYLAPDRGWSATSTRSSLAGCLAAGPGALAPRGRHRLAGSGRGRADRRRRAGPAPAALLAQARGLRGAAAAPRRAAPATPA